MRDPYYLVRSGLFIILLTFSRNLPAQQMIINEFMARATDISARENEILDSRNIPCSIIKVRLGISNASFSSDTEIMRTEKHQGEYWIWVSQGTKKISIAARDFTSLDYEIPSYIDKSSVYIITISVIFPEKIIYRDTMPSYVSFASDPTYARVYINDVYYGLTPIKVNIPFKSYSYKIKKGIYETITGGDTLNALIQGDIYKLIYNPKRKRTFILPRLGANKYGSTLGLNLGRIGKTAYYGSVNYTPGYGYRETKLTEFDAGITQQISNELFLTGGVGYSFIDVLSRVYYEDYYKSYDGLTFSTGVILRLKKTFLLNLGYSWVYDDNIKEDDLFFMGVGFNFFHF